MPGYLKTDGMEQLSRMLKNVAENAAEIAAAGLYAGAGVAADAMTQAVNNIATEDFRYAPDGQTRLASPEEKEALKGKTGIAHFRGSSTEIDTLIGFQGAGYANIGGKRKPVIVIARSINSGTSFMQKQPVFRRALSQARKAATVAVVEAADKKINELTK